MIPDVVEHDADGERDHDAVRILLRVLILGNRSAGHVGTGRCGHQAAMKLPPTANPIRNLRNVHQTHSHSYPMMLDESQHE